MDFENLSLAKVRERRQEIAAEDKVLAQIEDDLIGIAERYTTVSFRVAKDVPPLFSPPASKPRRRPVVRRQTKAGKIVEALNSPRPLWQTANEIRDYLSQQEGRDVPMSSVSPELTKLKNSETIVRKDLLVALALRVEKEEPGFLNENGEAIASPETGRD
jgi:hypothetical protein